MPPASESPTVQTIFLNVIPICIIVSCYVTETTVTNITHQIFNCLTKIIFLM